MLTYTFFSLGTDIWVQIGRGKVGLSGNIQVKSYIPKSKFDNVFDIRKEYCLYIQSICWVFQYNNCAENLWKYLGTFLLVPNFQNMIGWEPMTQGLTPISFWAQIYFFLAVIHLFVTAYLSKSLNLSEKPSKMIEIQYTNPKPVSPHPGHVRPSVGALGGRDQVQGVRQGAQGAAPSAGSLEPSWRLPGAQNTERGPGRSRCVYRSVT